MVKHFRRLSARGESALSCWLLNASAVELQELFGAAAAPGSPRLVRPGPVESPWDEGLLWVRPDGAAELHLHGGLGVAQALRAWLSRHGWQEDPAQIMAGLPPPQLPDAHEAEQRSLLATSPRAVRAWCEFRRRDGPATVQEGERLPEPSRRIWARAQLQYAAWAEALEAVPSLVLAGPPNAGKSSLFNAWLRAARATVADAPGTTRDGVGELLSLGPGSAAWSIQIFDTAGLWDAASGTDLEAVQRTETALAAAWKVLWILDASHAPSARALQALQQARGSDLFLVHRIDLGLTWNLDLLPAGPWILGSIQTEGESLLQRLEAALATSLGPPPPPEAWLPLGGALRAQLRQWSKADAPGG
jgi:hypothetical protein